MYALMLVLPLAAGASPALGACVVKQSTRKFEGADRTIVTMENDKILVEIAPELNGRIIRYVDKSRQDTPLEWLDDCVYHYGGRWEGKPFTFRIDDQGPDRASVTVMGGGKLAVALLRSLGYDIASPLDTAVERTMSIDANTTRLRIQVKITNTGDGVAPQLRYMVHSVYGQVPVLPSGDRAFWFLPTADGVEFFDAKRGTREMQSAGAGSAPEHPFNRFIKGHKADKPRFDARGWGAVLTSAGPSFIYYDPAKYDFMQFWFGGDASWHFTFEPHTRPIDLKPGESTESEFTLAYDSADVPFNTSTIAYEQPQVSELATPGSEISIKSRATTVARGQNNQVKIKVEIKDPAGKPILERDVTGELRFLEFVDMSASANLPSNAALGKYSWTAKLPDGKTLGSGKIEVLSPEDLEKRKTDAAIATLKAQYDERLKKLEKDLTEARKADKRWNDGMNLALTLDDPRVWPREPVAEVSTSVHRGVTRVLGMWKANEAIRFNKMIAAAAPRGPPMSIACWRPWGPIGRTSATWHSRPTASNWWRWLSTPPKIGRRLSCWTWADAACAASASSPKSRTKPPIPWAPWPAAWHSTPRETSGWGPMPGARSAATPSIRTGPPIEESVLGAKGALKKFSPAGKLLGSISMLDAPMDLQAVTADGQPVILASYRHVSSYYGAR